MINSKIICLFVLLFSSTILFSQNSDWKVIAKKDVRFKKNESDNVNLLGNERKIEKIKVKCVQGSLKFKSLTIFYKDDSKEEFKSKGIGVLTKGMSSFAFKVDKDKTPTKLELSYDAIGNTLVTKRAKVEILGLQKK
tara:strand:+ start:786 stop:1196 length:411 start_codon:yes stop_codon:yes gene_type:complete